MSFPLPRLLYLLGALALYLLLWPNPITIFMAACLSCLTLPLYRRLRREAGMWRMHLEQTTPDSRRRRLLMVVSSSVPLVGYVTVIVSSLLAPVAVLALLLHQGRKSWFQGPDDFEYV